jgi:hypothetical protein
LITTFAFLAVLFLACTVLAMPKEWSILRWVSAAWMIAWAIVGFWQPALWPVAALGFAQNIAFTFVSRGRNSGSLGYHLIAAIASNGIYAALLFTSIDLMSQAKSMPVPFLIVYTATTVAGSVFAHWMALRAEKGKQRSVQQDTVAALTHRIDNLEEDYNDLLIRMPAIVDAGVSEAIETRVDIYNPTRGESASVG